MAGVTAIHVIGPVIPWATLGGLFVGMGFAVLMAWAGMFATFTLETPSFYILMTALTLFAISAWPMYWVKLEFLDEREQPRTACFTPS